LAKQKDKKNHFNPLPVNKRMLMAAFKFDKLLILLAVVFTVTASVYPFLAVFLPKIALGALEGDSQNIVKNLLLYTSVYCIAGAVIMFLRTWTEQLISVRVMGLRVELLNKALHKQMLMDYKYVEDSEFLNNTVQNAMNVVSGGSDGFEDTLKMIFEVLPSFIAVVLMIIMTGTLNVFILLALIIHVVISMIVTKLDFDYRYNKKDIKADNQRKIKYLYNTTTDFSFGKDIRVYNFRDRIMGNYKQQIEVYKKLIKGFAGHKFVLQFLSLLTLLITNVVMYGALIYKTLNGMSISSFVMYISLITTLMTELLSFSKLISTIFNNTKYIKDFYDFTDTSYKDESGEPLSIKKGDTVEIVFDHVTFRYPNTDRNILTDLNLKISKGERLAIVGINGAGKSTIVKLITGLYSPTEGHIYINGKDITTIKRLELFNLYSAVFQEVNIMAFTIAENIAATQDDIDRDKVNQCLDKVGLGNKISSLDKGIDSMMLKIIDENGVDFSGGERQKLCIARALYKDSPMVIMDEPTAALDALAESEIYQNFSDLVKGKTAVYVSHRLASTKFCDKIALFSKDGLIEYGTHDELMALKGEYYNMFVIQGKYYQTENQEAAV